MTNFVYEAVGTYGEWQQICERWSKPDAPGIDMRNLGDNEVAGLVCTCYPRNNDRSEREIVFFKPAGSSTPDPAKDFWAKGANEFLDEQFPDTA